MLGGGGGTEEGSEMLQCSNTQTILNRRFSVDSIS